MIQRQGIASSRSARKNLASPNVGLRSPKTRADATPACRQEPRLDEASSDRPATTLTRRDLLKVGALGAAGLAAGGSALALQSAVPVSASQPGHGSHHDMVTVGELRRSSFDPTAFLAHFERGHETRLASGQRLCEFEIEATETELEVAPGVFFPAWAYNGQVPCPTLRCT
jgi:hypothetical protein